MGIEKFAPEFFNNFKLGEVGDGDFVLATLRSAIIGVVSSTVTNLASGSFKGFARGAYTSDFQHLFNAEATARNGSRSQHIQNKKQIIADYEATTGEKLDWVTKLFVGNEQLANMAETTANFAGGFVDGVTLGQGEKIFSQDGLWADKNTIAYKGGVVTSVSTTAVVGGGGAAAKGVARFGVSSNLVGKGSRLFGRGGQFGTKGIFQSGRVRFGWGWKGTRITGKDVFRLSWSKQGSRNRWNHLHF